MAKQSKSTPLRGAIVAIGGILDSHGIIGIDNVLPWHYSGDLKRFKKRTKGSVIIMGRKTWESIGCKELPGRHNVVISRSTVCGVEHYSSVEQAIEAYPKRKIWVIGGAQIYQAAMAHLTLLDITYVPYDITDDAIKCSDVIKFPKFDPFCWRQGKRNKVPDEDKLHYVIYQRIAPD